MQINQMSLGPLPDKALIKDECNHTNQQLSCWRGFHGNIWINQTASVMALPTTAANNNNEGEKSPYYVKWLKNTFDTSLMIIQQPKFQVYCTHTKFTAGTGSR